MATAASESRQGKVPSGELMKERPASQPQLDGGPIGGMCRMHAIIVLNLVKCGNEVGPEPSRDNRKSRVYPP